MLITFMFKAKTLHKSLNDDFDLKKKSLNIAEM